MKKSKIFSCIAYRVMRIAEKEFPRVQEFAPRPANLLEMYYE
jgi:hypothetical protein